MEQFEAYFQRADLDRDGRISGAEAVAFFKGSNLPQQVLAQIWAYADRDHSGFLTRPSFYNALKLVTVAQSKRELTPDIVKLALFGPGSTKIPAPQISLAAVHAPQPNLRAVALAPLMGTSAQPPSQNFGFKGQSPSGGSINQQFGSASSSPGVDRSLRQDWPSGTGINQQFGQVQPSSTGINQQFRSVQPSSIGQQFGQIQPSSTSMNSHLGQLQPSTTGTVQHFGQAPLHTNMNQQFITSQGNHAVQPPLSVPAGAASRPLQSGAGPSIPSGDSMSGPSIPDSKNDTSAGSAAPVTQDLNRGANPTIHPVARNPLDQFSAFSSRASQDPKGSVGSGQSSNSDPMFAGNILSANQSQSQQVSSAQQHLSTFAKPSTGDQAPQISFQPKSNQQIMTQVTPSFSSSGVASSMGSPPEQAQNFWPKMTRANVQKYAKVFVEVDTDRDGKITGEQAHDLFLSWRLPREVLKQVWDLSDQDSDSMLSLREFCIALYLMEQHRAGRPLPSALPNSVMLDETLSSLTGPPIVYRSTGWGPTTGFSPQQGLSGVRSATPSSLRSPLQPMVSQDYGSMQFNQKDVGGIAIDKSHQLSNGDNNSLDSVGPESTEINEKAEHNEKVLLDSREKLEFYRAKMQELVLYRSRCDNRLNEITERARVDKNEAELLEKKFQEKYKQVVEAHSKLTIEEASFREIQERKMELHQAIIRMEQGGSADGILQVRADRIQSDLEELLKALTLRCNKHAVEMKSLAVIELPPGWTPGIPEVATVWDEDWDKFEDEGFSFDTAVSENVMPKSAESENSPISSRSPDLVLNANVTSGKPFSVVARDLETESVYRADGLKSPGGSSGRETAYESSSQEKHSRKSSDGEAETHRNFDESAWGNFDNNDDIDLVWGFNAKESDHSKHDEKYFFDSNDFTAPSDGTAPPQVASAFQRNSPFALDDSVPGTPHSRAPDSPPVCSIESRDLFSDNFSRFDSFSGQGISSSPRHTRFDSVSSTSGFDHSRKFSFDDSADPFGSGLFKASSETPKKGSEWSSF